MLTGLTAAALSLAAPAQACPLTNPNCVVDKVEETANDTVHDLDETVDRTVEQVNDTTEEVRETVDQVEETVDDTLNPPSEASDPPPPPTVPEDPGPEDPTPEDPPPGPKVKGQGIERGRERERDRDGREREADRDAAAGPAPAEPPDNLPPQTLTPAAAEEPNAHARQSVGESAIEAVKDFAFPLILSVLVGIYVLVQHRVDRRDPKFVLAPVEHEFLSFE